MKWIRIMIEGEKGINREILSGDIDFVPMKTFLDTIEKSIFLDTVYTIRIEKR